MNKNHYCVILAGGLGTRLWPASRENLPKQFIDILGTGETLLQATYRRYTKIIDRDNIIVMSNEQYKDITLQQLPDLPENNLLLEPMRRNTVPSVVWASIHLLRLNPESVMLVSPADQLITDESALEHDVLTGFDYAVRHQRLLTMGVRPTRPDTAFGYIQKADEVESDIFQVKSFTEKPEQQFAQMFLESGEFLWNTGLFIWKSKNFLDTISSMSNEVSDILKQMQAMLLAGNDVPTLIQQAFAICPNIPLEMGVLEKAYNVDVMLCHFGWSDLGSWTQVFNIMQKTSDNNVVISEDKCHAGEKPLFYNSSDCIVKLPKGKIATVQDLHGYAIIDTGDVLMICKKDDQQSIRNFVNDVAMYSHS